ncbi:Dual specificity protein phosphatase [Dirofilaria immitis]
MSILEKIRKAREDLKTVETTVTMEDGRVAKEKRSSKGEFVYVDEEDEDATSNGDETKEMQEVEITFTKKSNLNGSQKECSEAGSNISLSNKQLKKRSYRQNLGYVLDLKPDLQMANVAKGIYLGSQDVAHDYDILMAHNITHIINCATGVKNIFLGSIKYLTFDVLDLPWTNLEQHFDKCHEFMEEAVQSGGNVLVHCNAGVSRSATIVLSYIMRYNKMTLREALEHVNAIRKVGPNPGFMQQLLRYEMKLQCENDANK